MKSSRSEFVSIRGLRYHFRHWGKVDAPKLFMVHGWMDVSASFQFVVDHMQQDWHIIAPDWRGYGLTDRIGFDSYWFADYVGDLDAILNHYAPNEAVNLLGHSMGGNVVCIYAGVRPERIAKLINLEGFGMPPTQPKQATQRYLHWLDSLKEPISMRPYDSLEDVMARLRKNNPRLSAEKAAFLAQHWAAQNADGKWEVLGDPAHKRPSPLLYHVEDVLACWGAIAAPVLWMEADDTDVWRWLGPKEQARKEVDRRIAVIPNVKTVMINDAGHMLHHDQPQAVATFIEEFLAA